MGKTRDNLFADGFTGKMGTNMVFRQKKSGTVIVAKSPRKTRNAPKESALKTRKTFKEGVAYAKAIMKDPQNAVLKAAYEAVIKGDESAYNVALRDSCVPPKVTDLNTQKYKGAIGDKIIVRAEDDFQVLSINIAIHAPDGQLIEEGNAVLDAKGLDWVYTASVTNNQLAGSTVTATAVDNPDNKGILVATL